MLRKSPEDKTGVNPTLTGASEHTGHRSDLAKQPPFRWKKSGKISMLKRREKQLAARPTRIDMKQGFLSQSQSQLADHPFSTTAAARDDGSVWACHHQKARLTLLSKGYDDVPGAFLSRNG
ncbi:hypothetical protein CPAR01_08545 [Colletotrichum paranaense]|uniref:Uncharacterized protein n=1 Tax=Colletotrichum paranaense TaxID=1914294 RepID=A0ABQ9SKK7_9PEZI|nr:uncharacterized protein CPAR01_08545 [Colletotrichum paranaense]KAK1538432.1 hypothetical protein CPAR01_08545 [Colletotrichum paranaense]